MTNSCSQSVALLVFVLPVLVTISSASAQTVASEVVTTIPPDVVRLNDGTTYRCTIVEMIPDDYVLMVTTSEELIRVDFDDLSYAGPAEDLTTQEAPAVSESTAEPGDLDATATEASYHLEANDQDIILHFRDGMAVTHGYPGQTVASFYTPVCTAPCDFSTPPGTYNLALSSADGIPVELTEPFVLGTDPGLFATYESNQLERSIGRSLLAGGIVIGSAVMLIPVFNLDSDPVYADDFNWTPVIAGGAVMLGSTILGFFLMGVEDDVHLESGITF